MDMLRYTMLRYSTLRYPGVWDRRGGMRSNDGMIISLCLFGFFCYDVDFLF